VSYDEGFNFANAHGLKFTETCAFDLKTIEPVRINSFYAKMQNLFIFLY
jgi:hypothetical protein